MSQLDTSYALQGGGFTYQPDVQRALAGATKQTLIPPVLPPPVQQPPAPMPDQFQQTGQNQNNNSSKENKTSWKSAFLDYVILGSTAGAVAAFLLDRLYKKPSTQKLSPISKFGKVIDKPFTLVMRKPSTAAESPPGKPHVSNPEAVVHAMEEKHMAKTFILLQKRIGHLNKSGLPIMDSYKKFLSGIHKTHQGIPINVLDHSPANQQHLKALGLSKFDSIHDILEGNPAKGIVGQIGLLKEKITSLEKNKAANLIAIKQNKALLKLLNGYKNHIAGEQGHKALTTSLAKLNAQLHQDGVRAPGRFVARSFYYVKHLFEGDSLGIPGFGKIGKLMPFLGLGALITGGFTFGTALHDARKAQSGDKGKTLAHSFWGVGLGNFLGMIVGAQLLKDMNFGGRILGKYALKPIPIIPRLLQITAGGLITQLIAVFVIGTLFQKTFEYISDKIFGKPQPADQDSQQEQTEAAEHAAKVSPGVVANSMPK